MGIAEIVVALCLQAEPGACRITRERFIGGMTACAVREDAEAPPPGWFVARWTCRWRQ